VSAIHDSDLVRSATPACASGWPLNGPRPPRTGKKFGLVFEDHLPELLPLPKARARRGDLVCRREGSLKDVWQVTV
jgi:hypothetical protein